MMAISSIRFYLIGIRISAYYMSVHLQLGCVSIIFFYNCRVTTSSTSTTETEQDKQIT